jgi:hypothetical protein
VSISLVTTCYVISTISEDSATRTADRSSISDPRVAGKIGHFGVHEIFSFLIARDYCMKLVFNKTFIVPKMRSIGSDNEFEILKFGESFVPCSDRPNMNGRTPSQSSVEVMCNGLPNLFSDTRRFTVDFVPALSTFRSPMGISGVFTSLIVSGIDDLKHQ